MMSPTAFFLTASGLMMVSVRSSVFISSVLGSQLPVPSLFLVLSSQKNLFVRCDELSSRLRDCISRLLLLVPPLAFLRCPPATSLLLGLLFPWPQSFRPPRPCRQK